MTRKRYFTIADMIITMMIIASISTVIGFNIFKAIRDEKFNASVHDIVTKINTAQKYSISLGIDSEVLLYQKEELFFVKLLLHENLHNINILSKPLLLKNITDIEFGNEKLPIALKFFSCGGQIPKGVLKISSKNDHRFISLYGYPHNIISSDKEEPLQQLPSSENIFPHDIYEKSST